MAEPTTSLIDDISKGLQQSKLHDCSPADTVKLLDKIIITETSPAALQQLCITDDLLQIIKKATLPPDVKAKVAKCIADLTKTEAQRKNFTEKNIMVALLADISDITGATDLELVVQVCRALGNIFYQNDEARDILMEFGGDATLIQLLDVRNGSALLSTNDDAIVQQFMTVRCGLLSNYLVGGETVAKQAMELNIMTKIERLVTDCTTTTTTTTEAAANAECHEHVLLNVLPPLSILTENVPDLNFPPTLNKQLVSVLARSMNPDVAEMCLDLLHYQAENDDVKLLLAKEGLCETICTLLEKYKTHANTSEARALMKLACEIIVLILTGDESMHYLYSTPLLKYIEDWLDSSDTDLLITGVLALGNFARTDSHCIRMVENDVMKKLLGILSKNNGTDDDMRLQHALLSTLRNLVIPKPNKPAIIEAGLVETIIPMLAIHQPPVVFKLLGTLRMTVDGQEMLAIELLQNRVLIEQLVHWSKSSDYASVTGESLRLMAWLIKHAYFQKHSTNAASTVNDVTPAPSPPSPMEAQSLRAFIGTAGAVECMVNMLTAQHMVMQNEALIALSILSAVISETKSVTVTPSSGVETSDAIVDLTAVLIDCDLGQKMAEFIGKNADTMTKEIVENLQTLMSLLRKSDALTSHLATHNIDELLKSIPILTEYCTL